VLLEKKILQTYKLQCMCIWIIKY